MSHQTPEQLTPHDIQFALDTPEYPPLSKLPLLRGVIDRPSDVEAISRRFQADAGPLGFLKDEDISNLKAAGVLIGRMNKGTFPSRPYITSDVLRDFGIATAYSARVQEDIEGNDFNMRPTDPGGMVNRLVLYERLGVEADQVFSPILGPGRDVAVIGTGDRLVYDKESKRLLPEVNGGRADGWIIKSPKLAESVAMAGFVADCPMVTLVFTEEAEDGAPKVVGMGMMHMGWQNIANGLDLAMTDEIKKQGFRPEGIFASVSPGARFGLKLPKQLMKDRSAPRLDFDSGDTTDMIRYGVKDANDEVVQFDNVQATVQLLWHKMGLKPEHIFVSDHCTISDPGLHSYRRDKDMDVSRPEAGRLAVVSMPPFISHEAYWRDALYGNEHRGESGALGLQADLADKKVFTVV